MLERLRDTLACQPGIEEHVSQFAAWPAWWVDGREFMSWDGTGRRIDLRLTRTVIRALRAGLRADPLVELRRGTSDWLTVSVEAECDLARASQLIGLAIDANRRRADDPRPPSDPASVVARTRSLHGPPVPDVVDAGPGRADVRDAHPVTPRAQGDGVID